MTRVGENFKNQRGFSLVELMVSVTIFSFILAYGMQFFILQRRSFAYQENIVETQQQIRAALDLMGREIMSMGSGIRGEEEKLLKVGPQEIEFLTNLHGAIARLNHEAATGQNSLDVEYLNNSGKFVKGKTILICWLEDCEWQSLAKDGRSTRLDLSSGLGRHFPKGSEVQLINWVRYDLTPMDSGDFFKLIRNVDGGASTVSEGIDTIHLEYLDPSGLAVTSVKEIRRIRIKISGGVQSDPGKKKSILSEIALRN